MLNLKNKQLSHSRTADKFVLRLPDDWRSEIEKLARANKRSMNSEILDRLERTFVEDRESKPSTGWTPIPGMVVVNKNTQDLRIIKEVSVKNREVYLSFIIPGTEDGFDYISRNVTCYSHQPAYEAEPAVDYVPFSL